MAENYRIDSHKLLFHPTEVSNWLKGETLFPIELEIGLSGGCNHRCIFCALDYLAYKASILDKDVIYRNLPIMSKGGVKAIIYAGEGEPMIHPDVSAIVNRTKELGIDVAMSTNGVLFTKEKAEECLRSLSWVRYSIAAATDDTYEKIHQCPKGDLKKVLRNMEDAVSVRKKGDYKTTLGAQMLLLEENKNEVILLGKIIKDLGFDYFTVKPFSQHPLSKAKRSVDYSESKEIGEKLTEIETNEFKVYFRNHSIENLQHEKEYDSCEGLNFMAHIDASGTVFPCVAHVGNERFDYGNIYNNNFDEIWNGNRAREIRKLFCGRFLKQNCRKACRNDEMNKYLNELRHPGGHVNFI